MAGAALPHRAPAVKARRLWWRVHHWAGLKLAIFSAFVFATGTLAVVGHEIDWLIHPSLRVSPASVAGPPDWARIAAGAARAPRVRTIRFIEQPTARAFAARVAVTYRDGTSGYLHVHPSTGVVQGRQGFVDAQRILRNLHRHLNLPIALGVPIVSALSIPLLFSAATSLVVYRRWWRGFLKPVRRRGARVLWGDLHRLLGVWCLPFALLIALTGGWYLVESLGGEAPVLPRAGRPALAAPLPEAARQLARAIAAARHADPELVVENVRFPTAKAGAFVVEGQRRAWLVRPRANAVWVEAASGRVLLKTDGRDLGLHQRVSEMADPLHFGTFGGYATKLAWFLLGAGLTGLSVSGAVVYAIRIGREADASRLLLAWRGMGMWGWLASAAVLTGFVMMPLLFLGRAGD